MPLLYLNHRDIILFDPNNAEHREIYHVFKKTHCWGKSKYRFVVDDTTTNLVDYCDRKLVEWYLNNEFSKK
jgi:hypothetical protein